jgi:acyl-CoA synthetase (AMP-forming)/AMP-acid ligase II
VYLTQSLHRSASTNPDRVATIQGDRVRTYGQLIERVARLAGGLRGLGVETGDRVAILSLNSDRYLEALFAIPWAGGVVNPVNIRWSPAEIAYSLDDSRARVLIVDDAFAHLVPDLRERSKYLTTVICAGDGAPPESSPSYEDLATGSASIEDAHRSGDDLAGIFYTGGTTGVAKGVMLSHANVVTSALGGLASGHFFRHGAPPRSLHVAPMFHLADFALFMMTSIAGGTNVALPGFDAEAVFDAIGRYTISDTLLVPTMIQFLVDHPGREEFDTRSLRGILYGASPISPALLTRALEAFPGVAFVQAYGMTELSAVATILGFEDHQHPRRRHSAGKAAPTSEVKVVDESGLDVPSGSVGEILVRGGQVMSGYWDKPRETAAVLRDGWMHTGDAGRLDEEGYLHVVDRIKDMIISGGENVDSSEVENALSQHPAVAACAVIGVPDERWGEAVHAVVVRAEGATVTVDDLQAHTRSRIAGYKVPRSIEFVNALPLSGAGKVLKRALRENARS